MADELKQTGYVGLVTPPASSRSTERHKRAPRRPEQQRDRRKKQPDREDGQPHIDDYA